MFLKLCPNICEFLFLKLHTPTSIYKVKSVNKVNDRVMMNCFLGFLRGNGHDLFQRSSEKKICSRPILAAAFETMNRERPEA
jgi:hypothetical protein